MARRKIDDNPKRAGLRYFRFVAWCCAAMLAVCCADSPQGKPPAVLVTTDPAGAKIYLNKKYVGLSPCRFTIVDRCPEDLWERHVIEARRRGYVPARKELRYRTGAAWIPREIILSLKPDGQVYPAEAPTTPKTAARPIPPRRVAKTSRCRKKQFVAVAPWAKAAPLKERAPKVRSARRKQPTVPASKKRKNFTAAAPWAKAAPSRDDWAMLTVTPEQILQPRRTGGRRSNFVGVAPWSKATPVTEDPFAPIMAAEVVEADSVAPPGDTRRLACELRLVRVADGHVLGQTSALAVYARLEPMANILVGNLVGKIPDGGKIVVVRLRNRRDSRQGRLVADEITDQLVEALTRSDHFRAVGRIELRAIFPAEENLENARDIITTKSLLNGADYILIGGVAMDMSIVSAEPAKPDEE